LKLQHRGSHLAGDHTILIAEVHDAKIHEGEPLLYFRGEYRTSPVTADQSQYAPQ